MPGNPLYLTFTGPINDQNVAQLIQQIDPLLGPDKVDHLYLAISTPGGGVNAGITLYNYLCSLPIKVTTHNIGQVDSIGNVIFLAGTERYAAPATSFLFHGVSFSVGGAAAFSRTQVEEFLSQVKQDEARIKTVIREKTKLDGRKLNGFFRSGRSLSPDEAHRFGIIHAIKAVAIPDNAQRAAINTFPAQN